MKKVLFVLFAVVLLFGLVSCENPKVPSQDVANSDISDGEFLDNDLVKVEQGVENSGDGDVIAPVGTQHVIDDLIGVTVYAYYAEKDIELVDWKSDIYIYNYIGIYLNIENLSNKPIDEVIFGSRRPETIQSVMPDFYIQTTSHRVALNGRFFGDGGTFDDYDQNEMFLMPGAKTDNCYVGYEIDNSLIDEFMTDTQNSYLVMLHDGKEYLFAIDGAEKLDAEK